jgi:hypothetical protein
MATLRDVLGYLDEKDAPRDLMAAIAATQRALAFAIPELTAYSNSGRANYRNKDYSPALHLIEVALGEEKPDPAEVWFVIDGYMMYFKFSTSLECAAFVDGVNFAANEWGHQEDYRQYDTEEEAKQAAQPDESECHNCSAVLHRGNMKEISNLGERVEPGSIMPSGQCPHCGGLCYLSGDDVDD